MLYLDSLTMWRWIHPHSKLWPTLQVLSWPPFRPPSLSTTSALSMHYGEHFAFKTLTAKYSFGCHFWFATACGKDNLFSKTDTLTSQDMTCKQCLRPALNTAWPCALLIQDVASSLLTGWCGSQQPKEFYSFSKLTMMRLSNVPLLRDELCALIAAMTIAFFFFLDT